MSEEAGRCGLMALSAEMVSSARKRTGSVGESSAGQMRGSELGHFGALTEKRSLESQDRPR